jgi:hypothetical protein
MMIFFNSNYNNVNNEVVIEEEISEDILKKEENETPGLFNGRKMVVKTKQTKNFNLLKIIKRQRLILIIQTGLQSIHLKLMIISIFLPIKKIVIINIILLNIQKQMKMLKIW